MYLLEKLYPLEEGCGRILIAHRITTIMHADRIIVMDKGKVAEQGSHEELLARGGIYRRIYDLQMNGIGEEEWVKNAIQHLFLCLAFRG